jgi:hypothetical protein
MSRCKNELKLGKNEKNAGKEGKKVDAHKTVPRHSKNPLTLIVKEKINVLEWLSPGSFHVTHDALQAKRVRDTGIWFLQDPGFKAWVSGKTSPLLFCQGIRITYK